MVEAVIGLRKHLFEVSKARVAFKERRHDAVGSFGIVETGERSNLVRLKPLPDLGLEQAAIVG